MRLVGHVARIGEVRNAYKILVGNSDRKRPLGSPKRRWEDSIRMNLREIEWEDVDWMQLAQDRVQWRAVVYMVINLRVPRKAGNFLTS
jgi:hypothetical protein